MCDGREPTACGIAHEPQPFYCHQCLRLAAARCRRPIEVAAQPEFLAREHDRGAMLADRAADQYTIAGAHAVQRETSPRPEADSGRRR
jgi:hypothetical protein